MNLTVIKKEYLSRINLENWLYLSVFLLPTYLIKVKIFIFPSNLWEMIVIIGFFWWFLDKKYTINLQGVWEKYKKYLLALGLIFFGLIVSTILNGNYRSGLGIIKGWFIFPLMFLFVSSEVLDHQKAKRLFRFFYLSALGVAVVALVYWFFGQVTFDDRLNAIFNSPNYLAMYLSPAIIIGLVLFEENKRFYFLSLSLILLAFFLTYSFAAWVAIMVAILVLALVAKKINKKQLLIVGLAAGVLFSLFVFESKNKKVEDLLSFNDRSSLASRMIIWKTTEKLIQDNFFWGIGPGNFQNKYLEYQKFYPPYLEWAVPHPHNLFLSFWLYSGLIGFIGFLVLLGIFFREFFEKQKNALKFMAFGIMLALLLHGLLDTTYFKNDLAVIFWLAYLGVIKKL